MHQFTCGLNEGIKIVNGRITDFKDLLENGALWREKSWLTENSTGNGIIRDNEERLSIKKAEKFLSLRECEVSISHMTGNVLQIS